MKNEKTDNIKTRGIIGLVLSVFILIFMKVILVFNLFLENRMLVAFILLIMLISSVMLYLRYILERNKKGY